MSSGRGELGLRIASAAVLVPFGLACLWAGGFAWDALVVVGMIGAAAEWRAMSGEALRGGGAPVVALAVFSCLLELRFGLGAGLLPVLTGTIGLLLLRWPTASVGLAYVGLPAIALTWLRGASNGAALVLVVMLSVWASDTGAYVAGRLFGGPKLAPSVSPSKTWSGAIGGLLCCAALGLALWWYGLFGAVLPAQAVLAAAALGVAAQLGDLFESAAKRRFGVKDSGRLIPGHGGLLDRLDGLMAASVLAAAWIWIAR